MKNVLVLGSGGARGAAHVGVLQHLQTINWEPDLIIGSSSGAIIGALSAAGLPADEIQSIIMETKVYKLLDFTRFGRGLLGGKKVVQFLKQHLGETTFQELQTNLVVNALDLNAREIIRIDEGSVLEAVHASMSIPGIFTPVEQDERFLFDAGFVNPLPTQYVPECDEAIIVDVSETDLKIDQDSYFMDVLRSFMFYVQDEFKKDNIDFLEDTAKKTTFIQPDVAEWSMLDFRDLPSVIQKGLEAAQQRL